MSFKDVGGGGGRGDGGGGGECSIDIDGHLEAFVLYNDLQ